MVNTLASETLPPELTPKAKPTVAQPVEEPQGPAAETSTSDKGDTPVADPVAAVLDELKDTIATSSNPAAVAEGHEPGTVPWEPKDELDKPIVSSSPIPVRAIIENEIGIPFRKVPSEPHRPWWKFWGRNSKGEQSQQKQTATEQPPAKPLSTEQPEPTAPTVNLTPATSESS